MAAVDVSEELRAWLRAEIDAQCFGEDFPFEVIPQVQVTPQGTAVQYVIIIQMRAPLLGQPPLLHVASASSPRPPREDVRQVVTAALQGLRALSRQLLRAGNGSGA